MSDKVVELTSTNFEDITDKGIVFVDFWAPWCGPCKMMGPILDEVADKVGDKAVIAKVNIDDEPKLANRFMIRSIPTMVLIKDGDPIQTWVGVQQSSTLATAIEKA